jgi:hypothetical protein
MVKNNPHIRDGDFDLLFDKGDEIIWLEPSATMLDVIVIAGIYPSKSRARNDGWDKPIPIGWWDKAVGKRRTRISIWNPSA